VLDVARSMFAELGYEATTNRAIAEASGITPGAIYHYFDSKAELYAAVYEEIYDRVFSRLEEAIVGHGTLMAQFAAALVAAGELNVQDPTLPAFDRGVSAEAKRHPELDELLRPLRRRNTIFFRRLVAAAAERGELAEDVDRRGLEDLLNAVAFGMARISAVTGDNRRAKVAVETLQRFLDGTLVAPT
jgi:AcrR family transcriptional regulator